MSDAAIPLAAGMTGPGAHDPTSKGPTSTGPTSVGRGGDAPGYPSERGRARETDIEIDVDLDEPFDSVYHREFPVMVRLAVALVDRTEQAEEVVQDAFAQLYLRYATVANPVGYLRVSVLNGCRKVLRRRAVARRFRPEPGGPSAGADQGFNHVLDAVRRLPDRQRRMIALRYDLQLTDSEIADTLGVPLGTVKSTIHRALTQLRLEVTP